MRRPRAHFSFRSPYSWMAVDRLLRRLPDAWDRLDWLPYWDPDERTATMLAERGAQLPYLPMSRAKHLYILQDTKRMAGRLGLPMAWPVDVDPWWELPHLAWLLAARHGRGPDFYSAVVAARWRHGEDVCRPHVVRALAAQVGLDGDELAAAPDSDELRSAGVDCLVAADDEGVFGVPFFLVGRQRFWGLDRVDLAVEVLLAPPARRRRSTRDDPPAAPVLDRVGGYDTDTAGGCG